jgi:hypothetical protein
MNQAIADRLQAIHDAYRAGEIDAGTMAKEIKKLSDDLRKL